MDKELTALLGQFYADLRERLDDVEALLLALEEAPDDGERLHALFRAFHTIKGNAGLVGVPEIQSACHAIETDLDRRRAGGLNAELLQRVFAAVDVLRACATEETVAGREAELGSVAAAGGTADAAPSRASGRRTEAGAAARASDPVPTHGFPSPGVRVAASPDDPLSLDAFRALVAAFAPLARSAARYRAAYDPKEPKASAPELQQLGMHLLSFSDAIPASRERLRATATYLELFLNYLLMNGLAYDPARFPLLERLVGDLEQLVQAELIGAPFLESILVDDAESLESLPRALDSIPDPSLVGVVINLPFDRFARAGRNLEILAAASRREPHTVFFVIHDDERARHATSFLAEALGGYPCVGTSVWDGLTCAVAPEE